MLKKAKLNKDLDQENVCVDVWSCCFITNLLQFA